MSEQLPKGWTSARLGDLAVEVRNGISAKPDADAGTAILRISAVRPMALNATDTRYLEGPASAWEPYRLRRDDLLFTRYNGNPSLVGVCARVTLESDQVLVYPDKLIRVRLDERVVLPAFVERAVHVGASRAFIDGKTKTSAGQVGISGGDLKEVPIRLPPLDEQRRIVAKLEALQARSRRAREALDAVPSLLEKLRQSILAAAFRGDLTKDWRAKNKDIEPASKLLERIRAERRKKWEESELAKLKAKGKPPTDDKWKSKYKEPTPVDVTRLPQLPSGWCWTSLGQLAWDAGYGTSAKCDYDGAGCAVLRIPNVARGQIDLGDVKRALEPGAHGDLLIAPADMLIVRTNGSRDLIGRAAVVGAPLPEPTSFASYLIRFRLVAMGVMPNWVGWYWQSAFVRALIEAHAASSAGQYNVSLGELGTCPVPIAPLKEQEQVIASLRSALETHATTARSVGAMLHNLHTLDRALLAKAFRGELVPQDSSDELAAALVAQVTPTNALTKSGGAPRTSKVRARTSRASDEVQ